MINNKLFKRNLYVSSNEITITKSDWKIKTKNEVLDPKIKTLKNDKERIIKNTDLRYKEWKQ